MRKRVNRPKLLRCARPSVGTRPSCYGLCTMRASTVRPCSLSLRAWSSPKCACKLRLPDQMGPKCVRCRDDGSPCCMCGAGGQKKVPCDAVTGDEL